MTIFLQEKACARVAPTGLMQERQKIAIAWMSIWRFTQVLCTAGEFMALVSTQCHANRRRTRQRQQQEKREEEV